MKRYLLALIVIFLMAPFTQAAEERPWPEMVYNDKSGTRLRLISLKEVTEKPFVTFAKTLLSTKGVFELYENGESWDEARAQRLWNRVFPRTREWFKGNNSFTPWTVIQNDETKIFMGFLGAHLHTSNTANEYKGVELCFATFPEHKNKGVLSNAIRTYAQTFSSQLNGLGNEFTRIFAPISPINFKSLRLVFSLGFLIGQPDTVDQPYVSSYYKELVSNSDKLRLLTSAIMVATKFHESADMIDLLPQNLSIPKEYWDKLKALRVVAFMPKEIFIKKFPPQ